MKKALIWEGKGQNKRLANFQWGPDQQRAFDEAKRHITAVTLAGGDPSTQYHLATDASDQGLGGVLYQMVDQPAGTRSTIKTRQWERPVMFMSFGLSDPETRYHTTEKEVLAVLRYLEEVR